MMEEDKAVQMLSDVGGSKRIRHNWICVTEYQEMLSACGRRGRARSCCPDDDAAGKHLDCVHFMGWTEALGCLLEVLV